MTCRNLPLHLYVWVDSSFMRRERRGFEPAVWFALRAEPGRAWGCHVMLECGAVYRDLPPHALAFGSEPEPWCLQDAQIWNCYGRSFDLVAYDYLSGLTACYDLGTRVARYLFTACPYGDGFSVTPEQRKEFMFMRTDGNRLLIRPTNHLLFSERSFTTPSDWPTDIVTSQTIWDCETAVEPSIPTAPETGSEPKEVTAS